MQCEEKSGSFGFMFFAQSVEICIENLHFVCFFRLKGLKAALAVLPSELEVELKSSVDQLLRSPPEGMA